MVVWFHILILSGNSFFFSSPNFYLNEYFFLLVVVILAFLLALILVIISLMLSKRKSSLERDKVRTYECGFNAYDDRLFTLSVFFYKIAILFVVLDVELIFLFPLFLDIQPVLSTSYLYFLTPFIFLFILLISVIYEFLAGSFNFFADMIRHEKEFNIWEMIMGDGYMTTSPELLKKIQDMQQQWQEKKARFSFLFSSFIYSDYFDFSPNLNFQKPVTAYMIGVEDLHHFIMFILIFIFIFVFYFLMMIPFKFNFYKKMEESLVDFFQHSSLELIWTIVPAIIL